MRNKSILLIVGGGIAAYKSLELIRLLKKRGAYVRVILTKGGAEFITPLSAATLTGNRVFCDLFDLDDESEIGHIKLAREADLIAVAPATADLMAKMAHGLANDLATTCLLASDGPLLIAPAMNPSMWAAAATKRNRDQLHRDGVYFIGPVSGDMACGEEGEGRMSEASSIAHEIEKILDHPTALSHKDKLLIGHETGGALTGRHVLVTAGPTHEPIDPVRYIANRSSGKQGYALAIAARELGARVTLVSGPTRLQEPKGVEMVNIKTAEQMLSAVQNALPADIFVSAAAVADWRVAKDVGQKLKKKGANPPNLELVETPDILKTLSQQGAKRPGLVIGFAAETQDLVKNARRKLKAKGCDWIVANDVSPASGTFGGDKNKVLIFRDKDYEQWPLLDKDDVAKRLMHLAAETVS